MPGRSDSKSFRVLDCTDNIRIANETIVREHHLILTGKIWEICPEMAHIGENLPMLGEYSYGVARVLLESGEYGE